MKTLLLFIVLFMAQLPVSAQEYVGMKFKDVRKNNPDRRYNMDSMEYRSTGADSLLFRFFYSTFSERKTYGTAVFYNAFKDSVITTQVYLYHNIHMEYVHQEFIRLSNKGYKVKFWRFDDKGCSLEIKR